MAKPKLVRLAESWRPDPDDAFGEDKRRLLRYLLDNEVTSANSVTLAQLIRDVTFTRNYQPKQVQQKLFGPLRRDPKVFVGMSNDGIFLVTSPEDADRALAFYTGRVRAELRHARNLRSLAKRSGILDEYRQHLPNNRDRAVIYLDESGNPDVNHLEPRVFIVAAVVIESRQSLAQLDQRFRNALTIIRRPENHELKTEGLSVQKHSRVLHELSLLDYQWAAACFDKSTLTSAGFADPVTFYRYAFQFLVGELLTVAWQADLIIDEHSSPQFQEALARYLRQQNSGLPVNRLNEVRFADSAKQRLVQLADLVAGAVRRSTEGQALPLREIEHKMLTLQFWPPR